MADFREINETAETASTGLKALGPVRVSARALRIRSSADSSQMHRGAVVTAVARQGEWLQIEHDGQVAFIHGDFVTSNG